MLCYAKSLQSCPTLCNPIDGSPPGSPIPGILQARTLEWVAISFSNAWKWKVKVKSLSRVRLLATPRTADYQPRPSMGFSRQEYWSGVPLPSPKKLIKINIKNKQLKNWAEDLKRHFPKEDMYSTGTWKMFNIANQRNANQNNNEIPPHTCQNDYHQKVYK